MAMRGVSLVVATGIVAELGDMRRFSHPRQVMSYLGLVPSEYSSGEHRRQGSITKNRKCPCTAVTHRSRVGVYQRSQGQSDYSEQTTESSSAHHRHCLESPTPFVQKVPADVSARKERQDCGHCCRQRNGGLHVGHLKKCRVAGAADDRRLRIRLIALF